MAQCFQNYINYVHNNTPLHLNCLMILFCIVCKSKMTFHLVTTVHTALFNYKLQLLFKNSETCFNITDLFALCFLVK